MFAGQLHIPRGHIPACDSDEITYKCVHMPHIRLCCTRSMPCFACLQANFTSLATPNQVGSGKTALVTLLHEGGGCDRKQSVYNIQSLCMFCLFCCKPGFCKCDVDVPNTSTPPMQSRDVLMLWCFDIPVIGTDITVPTMEISKHLSISTSRDSMGTCTAHEIDLHRRLDTVYMDRCSYLAAACRACGTHGQHRSTQPAILPGVKCRCDNLIVCCSSYLLRGCRNIDMVGLLIM